MNKKQLFWIIPIVLFAVIIYYSWNSNDNSIYPSFDHLCINEGYNGTSKYQILNENDEKDFAVYCMNNNGHYIRLNTTEEIIDIFTSGGGDPYIGIKDYKVLSVRIYGDDGKEIIK